MIRAVSLGYTYASGRTGLADIDLEVHAGELVALVGPNGSGKTTLLRLLARDLQPTAGTLELRDPVVSHSHHLTLSHSRIGWAPAEPVHFDELTGRENARWFARAHGAGDVALTTCLRRFDLDADADIPVAEYSFGMQRKLLVIEALAHEPALLLLDEPTIGLDPPATTALIEMLRARVREGAAVVIGTNDVPTAMLAMRVVFLHRGRKVADAAPSELLASVRARTRIDVALATLPDRAPEFPAGVVPTRTAAGFSLDARDLAILPDVCAALLGAGARIEAINVRQPDLTDVFARLTGERLEPRSGA